jgi:hypothetical protein
MPRLTRLRRSGWMTIGLVIGAVAVPAIAVGATITTVSIVGNNHTASVTPAGQLRTENMDAQYDFSAGAVSSGGQCVSLPGVPATRALIVKQININTESVQNAANAFAAVYGDADCGGSILVEADLQTRGMTSISLGSGIPVPAGRGLSVYAVDAHAYANAIGYSVQKSAVPTGAAALQHFGPAKVARAGR